MRTTGSGRLRAVGVLGGAALLAAGLSVVMPSQAVAASADAGAGRTVPAPVGSSPRPVLPDAPAVDKPTLLDRSAKVRTSARGLGARRAGGTACATGAWTFVHQKGGANETTVPGAGWKVEAWDRDNGNAHDLLATGVTDADGEYLLCFDNADEGSAGNDVYIKFVPDNGNWRVEHNDETAYEFTTGVDGDVRDGETANFGEQQPPEAEHSVGSIFDAVRMTWYAVPGRCWDDRGACRPVVHRWGTDSDTSRSMYHPRNNFIDMSLRGPFYYTEIIHETAHAIMDDVYDDATNFDKGSCSSGHSFNRVSHPGCAWSEGFADFLPGIVLGANERLEDRNRNTADYDGGDAVEGRVAQSLFDLVDSHDDGLDTISEGLLPIWNTFQDHNSTSFANFWEHRTADGYTVNNEALGVLFWNAIDYGYVRG